MRKAGNLLLGLGGVGLFLLLTEAAVPNEVVWTALGAVSLIGGLMVGNAFLVGAAVPRYTAVMGFGWVVVVTVVGLVVSLSACLLAVQIGDSFGSANQDTAKTLAALLGGAVSGLSMALLDAMTKVGYRFFARMLVYLRYRPRFAEVPGTYADLEYKAGWEVAIQEAPNFLIPGGWRIPRSVTTADESLRRISFAGWGPAATVHRLRVLRLLTCGEDVQGRDWSPGTDKAPGSTTPDSNPTA